MTARITKVLDHGFVSLLNIAGPERRPEADYDADDVDPARTARTSFYSRDETDREREQDLKLSSYLLKNRHTTPFEMIECWFEMKMPIFVARQLVRHRTVSINEVSARYVQLPKEFYIPEPENVGIKPTSVKQGRIINKNKIPEDVYFFLEALMQRNDEAYISYEAALKNGIPNELARCFLPLNIYTQWVWKQDLWNMMHFLKLRMDEHAQFESRQYAQAVHDHLNSVLPHSMSLFRKYILGKEET